MNLGKLYLIPNTLGDSSPEMVLPAKLLGTIEHISHFLVEDERNARRYLRKIGFSRSFDETFFSLLNEHTISDDFSTLLQPLFKGFDVGIISDAGVPGVADPGAEVVKLAHQNNIRVIPITGPSSIILSLMASGLNGQSFAFNGYIPIKTGERTKKLKELEKKAFSENQSQLFIEAPYRNLALFNDILSACQPETLLCVACDLTLDDEFIQTLSIREWRKKIPAINKRPAVFIIGKP
jgi:16S rRNA (cytidine1402-2'-O)-methyltransferase